MRAEVSSSRAFLEAFVVGEDEQIFPRLPNRSEVPAMELEWVGLEGDSVWRQLAVRLANILHAQPDSSKRSSFVGFAYFMHGFGSVSDRSQPGRTAPG